jgi:hypothetical protein
MKTTTRFLLSASTLAILALAMVLTFSSCSDDDKDSYGTCKEAMDADDKCDTQVYGGSEYLEALAACLAADNYYACEEEVDDVFDAKYEKCMLDTGVCGSASFEQCGKHFFETCEF